MDTAGKDSFDAEFFKTNLVALGDWPLEKLDWYTFMPEKDINEYKFYNPDYCDFYVEKIKNLLTEFDADILHLPIKGETKIKHHVEKILWLIQEYCLNGWKNPIKAINFLDNGRFTVHPGTNRCAAAKFLKLSQMPVIVNCNKKQKMLDKLHNFRLIDNEHDLRNSLVSQGKILWRTEGEDILHIDGYKQNDILREFTFEFTHSEAWPNNELTKDWTNIVQDFLPLKIFADTSDSQSKIKEASKETLGKKFENRYTGKKSVLDFCVIDINDAPDYNKPWIKISNFKKINFNIFELLYFINPYYKTIKTQDESIVINNPRGSGDKTPIIPDCYVRSERSY